MRPWPVALGLGAVIAVVWVLGVHAELSGAGDTFRLDREQNVPAVLSALLLGGAGLAWIAAARVAARARWAPLGFGLFVVFMALDELLALHELLERRSGVDWQVLYLPIMLAAAGFWLTVLARVHGVGTRLLWVAAAAAWAVAQALEAVQWDGDRPVDGYGRYMVVEEGLEMGGSLLFGLVALVVAARGRRRRQIAVTGPAAVVWRPRTEAAE